MPTAGVPEFLVALLYSFRVIEDRVPRGTAQIGVVGLCFGHVLVAAMVAIAFGSRMTIGRVVDAQQFVWTVTIALTDAVCF